MVWLVAFGDQASWRPQHRMYHRNRSHHASHTAANRGCFMQRKEIARGTMDSRIVWPQASCKRCLHKGNQKRRKSWVFGVQDGIRECQYGLRLFCPGYGKSVKIAWGIRAKILLSVSSQHFKRSSEEMRERNRQKNCQEETTVGASGGLECPTQQFEGSF